MKAYIITVACQNASGETECLSFVKNARDEIEAQLIGYNAASNQYPTRHGFHNRVVKVARVYESTFADLFSGGA